MIRHKAIALALLALTGMGAGARELPLPAIPTTLTETTGRADYLLAHYWDGMDFADREAVADEQFMGQNLANFLSVFPLASAEGRRTGVENFIRQASTGEDTEERLMQLIESYMLDRNSPVYDEASYPLFADAMIAAGWPGKESTAYLRDMTLRCLPGSQAPDFTFTTRSGGERRFSEESAGVRTMLLFYNPTCGECSQIIAELTADNAIAGLIGSGGIKMVAVYQDGDRNEWDTHAEKIPDDWTDGFTTADLADTLYAIPELPALYLVAPDGTIELKATDPTTVRAHLR